MFHAFLILDESEESKKQFEDTIKQTLGGLAQNAEELQVILQSILSSSFSSLVLQKELNYYFIFHRRFATPILQLWEHHISGFIHETSYNDDNYVWLCML